MAGILRRHVYLLLIVILVLVGVQMAVWAVRAIEDRRTEPPVKAARAFLAALHDGDCEQALAHLSAERRGAFEEQVRRERPRANPSSPRRCWTRAARAFHGLLPKTARLVSQARGHAAISLERHEADPKSFLIPGFWATRTIVTPITMRLVEEAGAWKVAEP